MPEAAPKRKIRSTPVHARIRFMGGQREKRAVVVLHEPERIRAKLRLLGTQRLPIAPARSWQGVAAMRKVGSVSSRKQAVSFGAPHGAAPVPVSQIRAVSGTRPDQHGELLGKANQAGDQSQASFWLSRIFLRVCRARNARTLTLDSDQPVICAASRTVRSSSSQSVRIQ